MLEWFANPAALTLGGAMISSPILIHLINRMRFRRLRWAAMEFLLKSQKRNRRRLIIEQLLLLALRCLLIALTGLLLARLLNISFGKITSQKSNLHVVVLDDSLSQKDREKDKPEDGFVSAKNTAKLIADQLAQSTTNDGQVNLVLSECYLKGDQYQPKVYHRLNDAGVRDELNRNLAGLECTSLSLPLSAGLKKAKEIADNNTREEPVTLHILTDFRKIDWSGLEAKEVNKLMTALGKHENVKKIYLIDCAAGGRQANQGGVPQASGNLGIVEVRPSTRVASPTTLVSFTVTVANFSNFDKQVKIVPYDDITGTELSEKNYETPMPFLVPANKTAQASFNLERWPEPKAGEQKAFMRIAVRLQDATGLPLVDGLADDNVRHAVLEIRKKVPVLIIDGNAADGRKGPEKEKRGGDSYYITKALESAIDSKYEVEFGDMLTGGDPRDALMLPQLGNYTSILMLNVPKLTDDQLGRLEQFVKEGGGVAFFMGPKVEAGYYNDQLYKKGQGLFPVPIEDGYKPPADVKVKEPEYTGRKQVELRDDLFSQTESLPIFGPVFKRPESRRFLNQMYIERYWPAAPMARWEGEPGRIRQIVNLPNENPASLYVDKVRDLIKRIPYDRKEYADYSEGLLRHFKTLDSATKGKAGYPATDLANMIDQMLQDHGKADDAKAYPNLVEFWGLRDTLVQNLLQDIKSLRQELLYASPLVLVKDYGYGRVVSWMTSAGTEWNTWGNGTPVYAPLIYELQNYLTSSSGDSGGLVGSSIKITVDGKRFNQNKDLKIIRRYYKPGAGPDKAEEQPVRKDFTGNKDGRLYWTFNIDGGLEPGFYQHDLQYVDAAENELPLMSWGHVFNVDTRKEGNLNRVSQDELDSGFWRAVPDKDKIKWGSVGRPNTDVINKAWELSEWPFFFLIFILILIGEQALAVHLSHHLRTDQAELPTQVVRPQARAA
jgi:hypothetical protein